MGKVHGWVTKATGKSRLRQAFRMCMLMAVKHVTLLFCLYGQAKAAATVMVIGVGLWGFDFVERWRLILRFLRPLRLMS